MTPKEQFDLFKSECKKWIEVFKEYDCDVYFTRGVKDEDKIGFCNYTNDRDDRQYTLQLAHSNILKYEDGTPYQKDMIKRIAFHEVMEMILSRLQLLGEDRFITETDIRDEMHRLIMKFENVIFEMGADFFLNKNKR